MVYAIANVNASANASASASGNANACAYATAKAASAMDEVIGTLQKPGRGANVVTFRASISACEKTFPSSRCGCCSVSMPARPLGVHRVGFIP